MNASRAFPLRSPSSCDESLPLMDRSTVRNSAHNSNNVRIIIRIHTLVGASSLLLGQGVSGTRRTGRDRKVIRVSAGLTVRGF